MKKYLKEFTKEITAGNEIIAYHLSRRNERLYNTVSSYLMRNYKQNEKKVAGYLYYDIGFGIAWILLDEIKINNLR